MKRSLLCLIIFGFSVLSGAVHAGEDTTDKKPITTLEEVVVTATRYEEKLSSVPANVTVITDVDIQNSTAYSVPDILRSQVGIQVTDIAGNRRNYRVDLRGFGETAQSNTLVLVDGRRINQADLSGTDWTLIPLDRIERIEIIRGGRGSVLYGDNASGGVINIITKEGEKFEAGLGGAGGSYDTTRANAYINGTQNNLSYALSGRLYNSDGYRDNSDMYAEDLGLKLGYLLGERGKVSLDGGYHKDETGLPGALRKSELEAGIPRTGTVHPDDFANVDDSYIKLRPEIFFLEDSLFQFDLSYRKRGSLFFSSFAGGTFEGNTDITTVVASPQFIFKEQVFGIGNNLTLGLDFVKAEEDILNTTIFLGFPSTGLFSLEKKNYGFYIHDEIYLIQNLTLSGGYRYDKVEYKFDPSTPDEADFDENLLTAGVNYNFYRESFVYFSFSEGFRYPLMDELFDFFTNTIDTTLVPQTSDDYEFGIRHYLTKTLYTNINFFRIDTENEIFFNPAKGLFGANDNLDDKIRRDGVEILLTKNFKNVTLRGSYTYTDAEIKSGQFSGNDVPSVPKHKASFDALFSSVSGFTFALNGVYIGERLFESDYANAFPEQDDFIVLNAKLKYNRKNFTAFLDINNLLNEEYSEYGVLSGPPVEEAFYPSPEINFLLGLQYTFR